MYRYLIAEGRFALGFILGIVSTIFAALLFGDMSALSTEVRYSLVGALIAAIIGIVGQVLIHVASDAERELARKQERIAALQRIFGKSLKAVNVFLQIKYIAESNNERDNAILDAGPSLMKPLFGSDVLPSFSEEDFLLALRLKDADLFNKVQETENIIENYRRLYPIYIEKFSSLVENETELDNFSANTGYATGKIDSISPDLYFLRSLQEDVLFMSYLAISHLSFMMEITSNHLETLGNKIKFSLPIEKEEIDLIREGFYSDILDE